MASSNANLIERWYWANNEAWSPLLYEWWFRRTRAGRRFREAEVDAVLGMVDSELRPGDTVLELGSGTGHYTTLLTDRGVDVVARDASETMVRFLRRRLHAEGRSANVGIGRLPHEPRAAGPFDGALAVGVLNYVEDLTACLETFSALLKPGGWVVFTVPPANRSGRRYRLVERLGRRRIYLRSPEEVEAAAARADLVVQGTPEVVGVMAVYRCTPSRQGAGTSRSTG